MKKQGAKPLRPVQPGGEVGHLDERLTEITTTTAQRLKKWRTPLIALVVTVILVQVGFFAVRQMGEAKHRRWNQEIYELAQGPESRREGYSLDPTRLEKLLGEVRGDPMEAYVYKTVVHFYLERAAALKEEKERTSPLSPASAPPPPDPTRDARALEALERASALAQEAASRLPGDTDVQVWAGVVKAKVAAEKDPPWSKTKRKYAPPVPGAPSDPAPGIPSGTAPGAPSGTAPGAPAGKADGPSSTGSEAPAPPDGKAPEKSSG